MSALTLAMKSLCYTVTDPEGTTQAYLLLVS